jgi:hypothetical protein
MPSVRCAGLAALLFAGLCGGAIAGGPPGPLKDWPCDAAFSNQLMPQAIWPGALPAPLPDAEAWSSDPQARKLVEFIASTENSANAGARFIDDFVHDNGGLRPELSMLVLTGMVERINKIRDIMIEGIRTHVIRSHILAEAVADNDASLKLAAAAPSADPARQPEAIRKARFSNLRSLDDVGDGAEMLCHRYSYDESKAKALAAALQHHTK